MSATVSDWVLEITNTTGNGPVDLAGSISNHSSFKEAFPKSIDVWYSLESENGDRECGRGFFEYTTNQLVRSTVDATLVGGVHEVYPNAKPIDLVGTTKVGCTLNAKAMQDILLALTNGALRGVRVYGPQDNTPTDAVTGDFWLTATNQAPPASMLTGTQQAGTPINQITLEQLINVADAPPSDRDALVYDDTIKQWKAVDARTIVGIDKTAAAHGQMLEYDQFTQLWKPIWPIFASKSYVKTIAEILMSGLAHEVPVLSISNDPPVSPPAETYYIVGENPTGAWVGHAKRIAHWAINVADHDGSIPYVWLFTIPRPNEAHLVEDVATVYSWDGIHWNANVRQTKVYFQGTAPSSTIPGDIWLDDSGVKLVVKYWNGSSWVTEAGTKTFTQATDPSLVPSNQVKDGDVWVDITDPVKPVTQIWADSKWNAVTPTTVIPASSRTFMQDEVPLGGSKGDMWVATGTGKPVVKFFDGTNWIDSGGARTFVQRTDPTTDTPPKVMNPGDFWSNNTDPNNIVVKQWNNGAWVTINAATPPVTAPSVPVNGDIYFDTAKRSLMYWFDNKWNPVTPAADSSLAPGQGTVNAVFNGPWPVADEKFVNVVGGFFKQNYGGNAPCYFLLSGLSATTGQVHCHGTATKMTSAGVETQQFFNPLTDAVADTTANTLKVKMNPFTVDNSFANDFMFWVDRRFGIYKWGYRVISKNTQNTEFYYSQVEFQGAPPTAIKIEGTYFCDARGLKSNELQQPY